MSKIVMLEVELVAPQIISGVASELLASHPELADILNDQTNNQLFIELIKELAIESLKLVADARSGTSVDSIQDYYGSPISKFEGHKIIAAIKTSQVHRGIGIIVDDHGKISFVGDSFGAGSAFTQIQKDFKTIFSAQATKTVLEMLGYQTEITKPKLIDERGTGGNRIFVRVQGARS